MMRSFYLLFVCLCFAIIYGCASRYDLTSEKYVAVSNPGSFERGKNIAYNVCGQCHYDYRLKKFAGKKIEDIPNFIGAVVSANLTRSVSKGILSQYSDAELKYLLQRGISNKGKYVTLMVRPNMAEEDINDLIVYLRSNDPAVSAADTVMGITHIKPLGKLAFRFVKKASTYNKGIVRPSDKDSIANGKYLVDIICCFHCHSKSILSLDYLHAERSSGFMQGGQSFKGQNGKKVYASNLTPDNKTGIGNYSKIDFRNAVREGVTPSGKKLDPVMHRFNALTDEQADAIYWYLRTLPAEEKYVKGH